MPPGCRFAPRCPVAETRCADSRRRRRAPSACCIVAACHRHIEAGARRGPCRRPPNDARCSQATDLRRALSGSHRSAVSLPPRRCCARSTACRFDARSRPHAGPGRRIGLRQVDHRQAGAGAGAADVGHGALSRRAAAAAGTPAWRGAAPARCRWSTRIRSARSTAACRSARRSRSRWPSTARRRRRRAPRARAGGDGRGRPAAAPVRTLSARTVGRPAPARRAGARADDRARAAGLRRADLRARRLDPGAGGEPAARPAGAARHRLSLHQPRPQGRAPGEPRRRGDVSRPHRRAGRGREPVRRAGASLYAGAGVGDPGDPAAARSASACCCRAIRPIRSNVPSGCAFHPRCPFAVAQLPRRGAGARSRCPTAAWSPAIASTNPPCRSPPDADVRRPRACCARASPSCS